MAWPHTQTCTQSGSVHTVGILWGLLTLFFPQCCAISTSTTALLLQEQCFSPHAREDKSKKVLRGLPSKSASGGKREKHILHSSLFMVPEGPLLPDEGLFSPLTPPLLIDMWNPSLRYSKGRPCVCLKGAHCWVEAPLCQETILFPRKPRRS